MHIVCAADNNYVVQCCAMLASLFRHNPDTVHTIHLLTECLPDEGLARIKQLVENNRATLAVYRIDPAQLEACPIRPGDHLTIATYYRLLMADILPDKMDKVLYLDCDIVVNGRIDELWDTDINRYAIAAVEEQGCCLPDVYDRLGFDRKYGYFNAGVLLINLRYWREHGLTKTFFNYLSHNMARLKAHDQDVLNALLHDRCLHIPFKWNVEECLYHYREMKRLKHNRELRSVLASPSIIHYTWKPKPWQPECKHPFRVCYDTYARKMGEAPWPAQRRWRALYDRTLFRLIVRLGIRGHRFYRL